VNREKHRHSASLWQIWSHTVDDYSRTCRAHYFRYLSLCYTLPSDSARHRSQDIFPPISQIVLKNSIKISLIIKGCPKEILIKLAIFQKISKSIWNTVTTNVKLLYKLLVMIGTVYIGGDCRSPLSVWHIILTSLCSLCLNVAFLAKKQLIPML
jgi:hypothetical protein